jgi:hypothetical protein
MTPTNTESGATQTAGAHVLQAVQHPELDTLSLLAIRDFLKKRARYLRLVTQNMFCCPYQCSLTNSYVDNNSSLISK